MVPLFRGLGYSIVVICCVSELYYAVICGWSFLYLFAGMQSEIPWTDCADGEDWHTPNCYTRDLGTFCRENYLKEENCNSIACTWYNASCIDMGDYCKDHGYSGGEDINTTKETVNYRCLLDGNETGM